MDALEENKFKQLEKNEDLGQEDGEEERARKQKILDEGLELFDVANKIWQDVYTAGNDDVRFIAGIDQWPQNIKNDREGSGRPCLTINQLPQFVRQVTNDQRQNRHRIRVRPFDDSSDIATAEVYQGLVRHTENISNAQQAYDTGFDWAVRAGLGFWRITTDYEDEGSFELEAYIKRIKDINKVVYDPFIQEADGSDANFAFVFEDIPKKVYEEDYPNSAAVGYPTSALSGNSVGWVQEETVRVAEFFVRRYTKRTLELYTDNQGNFVKVFKDEGHKIPKNWKKVDSKNLKECRIEWYKMNAVEILEEGIFPGKYIPIVPDFGEEYLIDGKTIYASLTRFSKDAQQMYNFWRTASTEMVALAPKTPYIGAKGQFKTQESKWASANVDNHAFLEYDPVSIDGHLAPPPQRQPFPSIPTGVTNEINLAREDLYQTTGIYPSALGQKSNETTGVAIRNRQTASQLSNYHFMDNHGRAVAYTGRILLGIYPVIYDTNRRVRILGEDMQAKIIEINRLTPDQNGNYYTLGVGKYDVYVDSGPSFASKREEASALMVELARANPGMIDVAGDIIAQNWDVPGSQELAKRLRKAISLKNPGLIPPEELEKIEQSGEEKMKEAMMQMQQQTAEATQRSAQLQQVVADLSQKLMDCQAQLDDKSAETAAKLRIAEMDVDAKLQIAIINKMDPKIIGDMQGQLKDLRTRMAELGLAQEEKELGPEAALPAESAQQGPTDANPPSEAPQELESMGQPVEET
jgi:gas vesicle protein